MLYTFVILQDLGDTQQNGDHMSREAKASAQIDKPKLHQSFLEVQRAIVARIESERRVVEGCRELIRNYQVKIEKIIARVWEG